MSAVVICLELTIVACLVTVGLSCPVPPGHGLDVHDLLSLSDFQCLRSCGYEFAYISVYKNGIGKCIHCSQVFLLN